jgi:hypothetical protein
MIWEREAEEREQAYINSSWRSIFTRYTSWAALILDEEDLMGKDHPFVKRLLEFQERNPYQLTMQTTLSLW